MKLIIFLNVIVFFLPPFTHSINYEVTDQVYFKVAIDHKYEGDILIGLFGNIVPRTVQNFKIIATEGIDGRTYNGTIFHRIIKRFMIQGGDIVHKNGSGTISIYGKYFNDENFHIKHVAAGYVSMANAGPNTNGCQFFITTMPTPWLNDHHTVFGKVLKGQRIVHMIEQIKTDVYDRPLINAEIIESGIVNNESSFYIEDSITYGLKDWCAAGILPLSFSFAILFFFHWVIKKLDSFKIKDN